MILKRYEIWCDSHNHEADGQLLLDAGSKRDAEFVIKKRGWEVMADGRTICSECLSTEKIRASVGKSELQK